MSIVALRGKILSKLSGKLKARIPQFAPESMDHDMVFFAYKDLITWLKVKWGTNESHLVCGRLNKYVFEKEDELDAFLNFWVDSWLEKWRDRVRILLKKPRIPKPNLERVNTANRVYREGKHLKELEEIVVGKLVNKGEICMSREISKNLILEEIAKRVPSRDEKQEANLDALEILSDLTSRIARLPDEKGPLVFLKVKGSSFR
ncbi:MAG: hypothetical protein ACETWE_03500 [Candidatus Bathyarchaeia archaeon]